ncbi:hypothetical protein Tco_1099016 [Tanacetum coccineum]
MTTLAEHIIVAGAENRPPMLEKSMYDSWESHIRLLIKEKKHGRMMLNSIDYVPLVYPTVEENGQTRPMKYSELTEAQQLQDDCDVQAMDIILHGLSPDVYALVNHQEAAKDIWDRVKMLMKGTELSYQERECRLYNLFDKFAHVQGETLKENIRLNASTKQWNFCLLLHQAFQTDDLDTYDSDCDDLSSAKAVLMANLSNCDHEVLSEVPYSKSYPNDLINQDVQQMQYSNQTHVDDFDDNEIHRGDKENQTNKMVNESLTAELERYKERTAIFELRLNVDLHQREKLIDSQMDDLIRNRNANLAAF